MRRVLKRIGLGASAIALCWASAAQAATFKNTFVKARDISDIINLDPAEVFELTTG